ncbi:hypothetical protein ACWKWC_03170 [Geodermatophilus nigrescens]
MPSYRLVVDHQLPIATFTAVDDVAATTRARELACEGPVGPRRSFSVEQRIGEVWREVAAWMPHPARRPALA